MPKRKKWVGKYFKLSPSTVSMLKVLAAKEDKTETELIEELIRGRYRFTVGVIEPDIAKIMYK